MNKSQLIEALAKDQDLTIKNAELVVTHFFESIEEALAQRDKGGNPRLWKFQGKKLSRL